MFVHIVPLIFCFSAIYSHTVGRAYFIKQNKFIWIMIKLLFFTVKLNVIFRTIIIKSSFSKKFLFSIRFRNNWMFKTILFIVCQCHSHFISSNIVWKRCLVKIEKNVIVVLSDGQDSKKCVDNRMKKVYDRDDVDNVSVYMLVRQFFVFFWHPLLSLFHHIYTKRWLSRSSNYMLVMRRNVGGLCLF